MDEHVNNQYNQHNRHNPHNGNKTNNIPQPPTIEGLYWVICQLQDQNRKLLAQMVATNQENNRRENEASNH